MDVKTMDLDLRIATAEALHDLRQTSAGIGSILVERDPPESSVAFLLSRGGPTSESGLSDAFTAHSGATAHFHAYAELFGGGSNVGVSVAAICRAALETWARGWWALTSTSPDVLAHRSAVLAWEQIKRTPDDAKLQNSEGEVISGAEAKTKASSRKERFAVAGEPSSMSYTTLAKQMLEAIRSPDPSRDYSLLSSAAHGEASSIHANSVLTGDGDLPDERLYAVGFSESLVRTYTWIIFETQNAYVNKLLDIFDAAEERDVWVRAHGYTVQRLVDIDDESSRRQDEGRGAS